MHQNTRTPEHPLKEGTPLQSTGALVSGALVLQELEELRERGLYRKLRTLSVLRGTHAFLDGRELVLFCGNDYLGLSQHPRVIEAAKQALDRYGAGAGAARLISGTSELHSQLESELARFKRKERALVFGSGYLTNLGVLSALAGEKDLVVMDKLSHASLIDGARLSGATLRAFPHKNYSKCEEILEGRGGFKTRPYRRRILVSDSVFSMEGDSADLETLARIKEKYDCILVIDDAHGFGVFGETGRGMTEGFEEKIDVIVATLSKALGVFGGFAAASSTFIEYFLNVSRPFIFATAPPPALASASLEALRLITEDSTFRARLWHNVDCVRDFLESQGLRSERKSPIFPIVLGNETRTVEIAEKLLTRGILIPGVRYPSVPKGKARLRLTVSAAHSKEDLEKLFRAFSAVLDRHCEAAIQAKPKQSL